MLDRRAWLVPLLATVSGLSGLGGCKAAGVAVDCPAGTLPVDGRCLVACTSANECLSVETCTSGVCQPRTARRDATVADATRDAAPDVPSGPDLDKPEEGIVEDKGVEEPDAGDSGVRDAEEVPDVPQPPQDAGPGVNLQVVAVRPNPTLSVGSPESVQVDFQLAARVPQNVKLRVLLNPPGQLTQTPQSILVTDTTVVIAVGSSSRDFTWTIAAGTAPTAQLELVALLDPEDAIAETDESDNAAGAAVTVDALDVSPESIVFPTIPLMDCVVGRELRLTNRGTNALSISSITASNPAFRPSVGSLGGLAAGASTSFRVQFVPQGLGPTSGAVDIGYAPSNGAPPLTRSVQLDGEAADRVTVSYTQSSQRVVDVVLFVEEGPAALVARTRAVNEAGSLLMALSGMDYQITVVGVSSGSASTPITPSTGAGTAALAAQLALSGVGPGQPSFFSTARMHFRTASRVRRDAWLVMVFIGNNDDDGRISMTDVVSALASEPGTAGVEEPTLVHALGPPNEPGCLMPGSSSSRLSQVVGPFGGIFVDGCLNGGGPIGVFDSIAGANSAVFGLPFRFAFGGSRPAVMTPVEVTVGGQALGPEGFEVDVPQTGVVIHTGSVPAAGSTVELHYAPICP